MEHPTAIRPQDHAVYRSGKMGKSTLFRSERILVGLNAFEPGQEHALHTHAGMDKVYQVIEGEGLFLLDGETVPMRAGSPAGGPGRRAPRHPQHRHRPPARPGRPGAGAVTHCSESPVDILTSRYVGIMMPLCERR